MDAATFVISAALVVSIRRPFGRGSTTQHPGVLAGFRVILRERALRLLVGAGMTSLVGIGIVGVVAYPLSLELGGGTEAYGAMTALLGGGGVVGAALAGRVLDVGPLRVLVSGFAAGAAGLALAGVAPVLAVALGGMTLAGAGRGLGDVAATTLLQARAANEVRSRVFAAEDGAAHVAYTVAALIGALIVVLTSARGAFAAAAACGVVAVVVAVRIPREPGAAQTPPVRG